HIQAQYSPDRAPQECHQKRADEQESDERENRMKEQSRDDRHEPLAQLMACPGPCRPVNDTLPSASIATVHAYARTDLVHVMRIKMRNNATCTAALRALCHSSA